MARRDSSVTADLVFTLSPEDFRALPLSTFAYWLSDSIRDLFKESPQLADIAQTRTGMGTLDDFRFLRLNWEVETEPNGWVPYAKGETYRPFLETFYSRANWREDGKEVKVYVENKVGSASRRIQAQAWYFRPGLTWVRRTHRLCVRVLPEGAIFSGGAQAVFPGGSSPDEVLGVLALLNSRSFDFLTKVGVGRTGDAVQFEPGMLNRTPVPRTTGAPKDLAELGRRGWHVSWRQDRTREPSRAFLRPAALEVDGDSLAARAEAWQSRVDTLDAEFEALGAEIDEQCFDLYGLNAADRDAISENQARDDGAEETGHDQLDDRQDGLNPDASGLAAALVSWAVGVAFGRYDVRLATGERGTPPEPQPFDPVPICPPAMLADDNGLPARNAPPGYAVDVPSTGVLVDDVGHTRDVVAGVRAVFAAVFGDDGDAFADEAAALLDPHGHDVRNWLRSSFFEYHLKLHSKNRRRAPILWQLGTPSSSYSIWLYAHRLTTDSLFQLQDDVLAPKLAYEERQLANLVESCGGTPSARERRDIEAQERFAEELRVMLDEVKRVAPLWRPTLDDGIVLVMAPLWRLVPHKPWQRELKKKWSELAAGKYDWAQLAMHLWPERVVPKCGDDRSLAIAHGLEEVFWIEEDDGKWRPRQEATTGVNDLIRERTSAAVKDALGALA